MQNEIDQHGIILDFTLEDELTKIITATSLESTPHMKLVWEQQKKALSQPSKNGHRWHPHFIRFSLSLHSKSPSVYRELRDSGTLQLPTTRTLRSYRNSFQPGAGYLPENIASLILRTTFEDFSDFEDYYLYRSRKMGCCNVRRNENQMQFSIQQALLLLESETVHHQTAGFSNFMIVLVGQRAILILCTRRKTCVPRGDGFGFLPMLPIYLKHLETVCLNLALVLIQD